VEQGFPMRAGHSDIMSDMAPAPCSTACPVSRRTTYHEIRNHRMQWGPTPAALFVGEVLAIEDEGDDGEAGGDRSVRGFSPSYSDCSGTNPFCRIRCTKVHPIAVVNCGDPSSSANKNGGLLRMTDIALSP
jgi:hypothetical protein